MPKLGKLMNNNIFLDMDKAKLISKSIVFVDKVKTLGILTPQTFKNSFSELINPFFLKTIMGVEGNILQPSPISQGYIFGDFTFSNNLMPSKFIIKHNTDDKENLEVENIVKKIVETVNISDLSNAIGINFELYIEHSNLQKELKDFMFNNTISNNFDALQVKMAHKIDDNTKLNLTVSDATVFNKKSIHINANIHNDITKENTLDSILIKDFWTELKEHINFIFEDAKNTNLKIGKAKTEDDAKANAS